MGALEVGRSVLRQEAVALERLSDNLDESFVQVAHRLLGCAGRVVTCGLGKSGHIARKTAGTLSSTGTPSLFLHAAEALHGDLGMITASDIVLLYTHSGETEEVIDLFPSLRAIGATTVTITGRPDSSAARAADFVLDTGVREEACPFNLAPTTSTTAMLALSDALALAVMELRDFDHESFARLHPKGSLGKRLTLRVYDVMRPVAEIAVVSSDATGLEVIRLMTDCGVGVACVAAEGRLLGLISESDWRRHYLRNPSSLHDLARDMMNAHPAVVSPDLLAIEAIEIFRNFPTKIGELPVIKNDLLVGLIVLKDLIRSGVV